MIQINSGTPKINLNQDETTDTLVVKKPTLKLNTTDDKVEVSLKTGIVKLKINRNTLSANKTGFKIQLNNKSVQVVTTGGGGTTIPEWSDAIVDFVYSGEEPITVEHSIKGDLTIVWKDQVIDGRTRRVIDTTTRENDGTVRKFNYYPDGRFNNITVL